MAEPPEACPAPPPPLQGSLAWAGGAGGQQCPSGGASWAGGGGAGAPWVLVAQRGGCSFAAKVAHGQALGAAAVVIANAAGSGNEIVEVRREAAPPPSHHPRIPRRVSNSQGSPRATVPSQQQVQLCLVLAWERRGACGRFCGHCCICSTAVHASRRQRGCRVDGRGETGSVQVCPSSSGASVCLDGWTRIVADGRRRHGGSGYPVGLDHALGLRAHQVRTAACRKAAPLRPTRPATRPVRHLAVEAALGASC